MVLRSAMQQAGAGGEQGWLGWWVEGRRGENSNVQAQGGIGEEAGSGWG